MKTVEIFTDGACSGNPGPARWTIVVMQDAQTEPEVSSAAVFARLCDALAAGEDG